jgi:heavy-metal resistance protein CzcE
MKPRIPMIAAFGVASALSLVPATAADMEPTGQYSLQHLRTHSQPMGRFGSPAGNMPTDREITLDSSTRSVSVKHNETVLFKIAGTGREFRWRFDTPWRMEAFPFGRIAPTDVSVHPGVMVYVSGA